MKRIIVLSVAAAVFFCFSAAFAQSKSCEDLKAEIDAKIKAKGVKDFTLEIIPADQVKDQKIVGSCAGGKKKISYSREKGK